MAQTSRLGTTLYPTIAREANELVWRSDVEDDVNVFRFECQESVLIGRAPDVEVAAGVGEELWRVSLKLPGLARFSVDDFRRAIQGSLCALAARAFQNVAAVNLREPWIHSLMLRTKAFHDSLGGGGQPDQGGGVWTSYTYKIRNVNGRPGIRLPDFCPMGMMAVPLHTELEEAWRGFREQYQNGSDPDPNEMDMRAILLYLRVNIFPYQRPSGFIMNAPLNEVHVLPTRILGAGPAGTLSFRPPPLLMGSETVIVSPQRPPMNSIPWTVRPWMPAGGCRDSVADLLSISKERADKGAEPKRSVKGNASGVLMDLNNIRVWCPNVKGNNCFFACVKRVLQNETSVYDSPLLKKRIELWRPLAGATKNGLVTFQQIQRFVSTYLQRRVLIFDEQLRIQADIQPDEYQKVLKEGQEIALTDPIELVLFREHFFHVVSRSLARFMCNLCGKRNVADLEKHQTSRSCSVSRQNFYQLKQAKCIRALNPVDLQDIPAVGSEWTNFCFYDFETFFDGVKHNVYAVGGMWWNEKGGEEYFSYYGETALDCFLLFLSDMAEVGQKLVLVSYNGSGFDHYMLLEQHLKYGTSLDAFLMNRGRLLQMNFWGHRVIDLFNFLGPASLDFNCQAYNIPVRKHVFPHLFPKQWDDVYYRGPLLGVEFYPEKMRADASAWLQSQPPDAVFDFEKESEFYLRRDVECLTELGRQFMKTVWKEFNIYLPNYITLSQMAFDLWRGTLLKEWRLPLPIESDFYDAVNAATYGGRCHFVKRFFRSSQPDSTPYADISDYLVDLDVVSLYPASMQQFLYPEGDYELWEDDRSVQTFQDMYDHFAMLPLSLWEVSVAPPKHLLIPALPRKNDEGSTVWDVESSDCQWYTSVDLETARELGYTFTFRRGYVWKRSAPIFRYYIDSVFAKKAEQDVFKNTKDEKYNPAARDVYKKLMNALYGKMMQKRQAVEHLFLTGKEGEDHQEWTEFLEKHGAVEYTELNENVLMVTGERLNFADTISKPHYLGAFVLAYSRKIMNGYFNKLDPLREHPEGGTWMDSAKNSMFYTDTDSLIVHASRMSLVESAMGSELGKLADELSGGKILEGYFLSPKLYCVKYMLPDGSIKTKLRGKGIPNAMLTMDHFRTMLFENEPVKYEFTQLRKLQADLNKSQEAQGMQPFTVISLLGASRTLNKDQTYSKPGLLGGRMVLHDVSYSWPVGFEPFQADLWDLVMQNEEDIIRPTLQLLDLPSPLSDTGLDALDDLLN